MREDIDEDPSDEDVAAFDRVTVTCPECKAELYDDVAVCWKCGHALAAPAKGPPAWAVVTAIGVLVVILATIMFGRMF